MNPSPLFLAFLSFLQSKFAELSFAACEEYAGISAAHQLVIDKLQEKYNQVAERGTRQDISDLERIFEETNVEIDRLKLAVDNCKFKLDGYNCIRREITVLMGLWHVAGFVRDYSLTEDLDELKGQLRSFLRPHKRKDTREDDEEEPEDEDEDEDEGGEKEEKEKEEKEEEREGEEKDDEDDEEEEEEYPGSSVCFAGDIILGYPWMREILREIGHWAPEGDGEGQSEEL